MRVEALRQRGRRAGHSDQVEWLGRAGLLAQGAIYALVALLALEVAVDGRDSSERPDKEGALRLVEKQPLGKVLLVALGLGFAAYAIWRLAQALVDRNAKGTDAKGLAKRAGYLALGSWYASLAVVTARFVLGSGSSGAGSGGERKAAAGLLGAPLGRELVLAAGGGFFVAAGWNVYRAFSGKLDRHLRVHEMSEGEHRAAVLLGGAGHLARGAVFLLVGGFLAKAAWEYAPSEAKGLDGALLELASREYGPLLLGAVAAGLFAFALWCAAQARYRVV